MSEEAAEAAAAAARAGRAWEFKRDLAAGALMGGAVHTVVAPIERVKLLLQTQDGNAALLGRSRRFGGFFDCVACTVREEGVLSLWRGNGTAVILYYPSVALNFSLKDLYRNILKDAGTSADKKFTSIALTNFIAAAGSSPGRPKKFSNVFQHEQIEGDCDKYAEKNEADAAQKEKNYIETLDFLDEMEERFSLDMFRQKFALNHGLPFPPPSWDREPTPPIPSSPPPAIIKITNFEEAKKALMAWSSGSNVHLEVSELLSLSVAEQMFDNVKEAKAESRVLNLSILKAKALQAKFILQKISQSRGEIDRYNSILSLPWIPTPTLPSYDILKR